MLFYKSPAVLDMVCITWPKRPEALLQQANSDVAAKAKEAAKFMCLGCRAHIWNQKPSRTRRRGVGLLTLNLSARVRLPYVMQIPATVQDLYSS